MTPEQAAYTAGIIDGEGCITISVQKPGSGGRLSPSHRLYLKVTMGHLPTIEWLRDTSGVGSIHIQRGRNGHNDAWSWWVAGRQAASVIRTVRPLLITKADEADVALEFDDLPRLAGGSRLLTPEIVAARQECFERIRDLKPSSKFRKDAV